MTTTNSQPDVEDEEEYDDEEPGKDKGSFARTPHGLIGGVPLSSDPIEPESFSFRSYASKLLTTAVWAGILVTTGARLLDGPPAQHFMQTTDGAIADEMRDLAARRAFTLMNVQTCVNKFYSAMRDSYDAPYPPPATVKGLKCSQDVQNPHVPSDGLRHTDSWTFSAAGDRFVLTFPPLPRGPVVAHGLSNSTYFEINRDGEIVNVRPDGPDATMGTNSNTVKEGKKLASFAKQVYGANLP